mmetsp:Transcript_80588/g.236827  ORF Transcript_80588/g.236827 Transcript_80588/m.236827 type:complete len:297 (+) Transcript_80588:74-964(+)
MRSVPSLRTPVQGIGQPERSSLRPSSARYSFSRQPRDSDLAGKSQDTPGPAAYDVSDYASALGQAAAVVGTAPRKTDVARPCESADAEPQDPLEPYPDSNDFRYPAPSSAVFGTEAKQAEVTNPDLLRVNPECRLGRAGPGFVYTPNERKVRPSSAPAYSIPRGQQSSRPPSQTSSRISPQFYYAEEAALGVQRDSRRKTRPASSFSKADRFAQPKQAEGEITAECKPVECGRRQRRPPSATFGSSTREASAKTRNVRTPGDRGPSERMGPPRIPHPQVAPRQEILRYSAFERPSR